MVPNVHTNRKAYWGWGEGEEGGGGIVLYTESRRDQEEGSELDSHEEFDYHLRVQARSRGEVVLDPQESPGQIESREVEMGSESWTALCFSCSSKAVLRTLSL